jgi:hypothetical protein
MKTKRLMLDKLVKARKESIRIEILQAGQLAYVTHKASLNARLGKNYMPEMPVDFAGAMKNKRTISSLHDAVNGTLATAKIKANEVADKIQANLKTLRETATEYAFLFSDAPQLVLKANDDFAMLVKNRIAEHQASEQKKKADQCECIRTEEAAKLAREQAAREAEAPAAPNVVAMPISTAPPTPPVDTGATMKLGDINARLAPIALTADGLASLGFPFVATDKAAKLYRESDFELICAALVNHINQAQLMRRAA